MGTDAEQDAALHAAETQEASQHPYCRPRDAATMILVDRASPQPRVLVGRRHDNVVFMPGKFVFPGGRVDKNDHRIPIAAPIPPGLEVNLLKGRPKISSARARALVLAAIRETCEETGLCVGRKIDGRSP
ncbi:MAG: NUDIX hydrolase, partial [Alphaproteobacteria bacterium]|nr:NUDIX hydrolase [Alphaproteobacteria bacterium]